MLRLPFGRRRELWLDLGSDRVKWLLERRDGGFETGDLPTPPGAVRGTYAAPEIDAPRLAGAVRSVFAAERGRFTLRLVLGDQFMKLVYLRLPRDAAPRADRDFILFRARRALDESVARDAELDAAIHEGGPDSGLEPEFTHLTLLAARRELLKTLRDAFHGGPFELAESLSSSAALCAVPLRRGERDFALVHLGHEVSTVNLVAAGVVMYQRVIETAGRHLAAAIREAEGVDDATARLRLERETVLPDPAGDLGAALACYPRTRLLFAPLLDECAVTFKFFRETLRRPLPAKLLLSGGLAALPGLPAFFGGVLGMPAGRLAAHAGGIDFTPANVTLADALLRKEAPPDA